MSYKEFIYNIINTRGQWNIPENEYKEKHHIIPRCLGGSNKKENIIYLTAEEHFEAHKLLALENANNYKLVLAWQMMAFVKDNTNQQRLKEITAEEYATLKKLIADTIKQRPTTAGYKFSDESRAKISAATTGRIPWNKGLSGFKNSEESNKKRSETMKAHYQDQKFRAKMDIIYKNNQGKKRSDAFKEGQKQRAIGNTNVKGYKWFNNGQVQIRCLEENKPEGFVPGRLTKKP